MLQSLPQKQKIVWSDNTYYFLTNSTYLHYPYFKKSEQKQLVFDFIKTLQLKYSIPVQSFAILITHQHLMFYTKKGEQVTFVKRFLKNSISREYRKIYHVPYKEFWHSTRVYRIKDEKMYWGILGYICGNLLKHKEVSNFQELYNNPFSSFKYIADKYGFDAAKELVLKVIKLEESAYGEVETEKIKDINITALKRA